MHHEIHENIELTQMMWCVAPTQLLSESLPIRWSLEDETLDWAFKFDQSYWTV